MAVQAYPKNILQIIYSYANPAGLANGNANDPWVTHADEICQNIWRESMEQRLWVWRYPVIEKWFEQCQNKKYTLANVEGLRAHFKKCSPTSYEEVNEKWGRGSISPVYFQDFENTICDALNLMRIWPRLREVLMKTGNVVPNYACEKEIKSWLAWQNNEAKVSALNSITKLDLSNLNLKRLPAFFCSLTFANLTELNLAQNQIENVPEGAFGNCPKLMLIKFSNT